MSQNVSAFYLPKQNRQIKSLFSNFTKGLLISNVSKIINSNNLGLSNFNSYNFANNFLSLCKNTKTMKYSIAVLQNILLGKSVRSSKLLNIFYNNFSSVISSKLNNLGYSNIKQFISDLKAGRLKINPSVFLQEFADGLVLANKSAGLSNNSRYGDVLPIDVVEHCEFIYKDNIAIHKVSSSDELVNWVSDMTPVVLNLKVHINNSSGQLTEIDSYVHRLSECMSNKIRISLRLGNNIYQNCIIEALNPSFSNVYILTLNIRLRFVYHSGLYQVKSGDNIILNPTPITSVEKLLKKPFNAGTFI